MPVNDYSKLFCIAKARDFGTSLLSDDGTNQKSNFNPSSSIRPGPELLHRPRTGPEIEDLVVHLACEKSG